VRVRARTHRCFRSSRFPPRPPRRCDTFASPPSCFFASESRVTRRRAGRARSETAAISAWLTWRCTRILDGGVASPGPRDMDLSSRDHDPPTRAAAPGLTPRRRLAFPSLARSAQTAETRYSPDFSFLFREVSGGGKSLRPRIVRESDQSTRIALRCPLTTIASRLGSGVSSPDRGDENIKRPFLGISANSRHARGWIGTTLRRREMRKVEAAARALPFNPFRASSVDANPATPVCLAAGQFL